MSERTYQVIIGVLVLVVLVGGWMLVAGKGSGPSTAVDAALTNESASDASGDSDANADTSSATENASSAVASVAASGEAVKVVDQVAGGVVMAELVALKSRGWVAVQDEREWILGAARLEEGTHTNVTIELLRGTEKGGAYKAIIFVDDGDGVFDLHKDTVIKNSDGSALSVAFIAK